MTPMSWAVDRPILSTTTVGFITRYPRAAPSRVSARAANGSASASARSASATVPGAAPSLPRWPLSSRCASGSANRSMPAVHASDTTTTGMTAARRMAGTRSSWPRRRSRAMKLTSPTHAPSPAADLHDQEQRDRGEEGARDGLGVLAGDHHGERQGGDRRHQGPDQVQGTAPGHVLQPRPGLAGILAWHGQRRGVGRRGRHHGWPRQPPRRGAAQRAPGTASRAGPPAAPPRPPGAGPGRSSRAWRRRASGSRAVPPSRCRRT